MKWTTLRVNVMQAWRDEASKKLSELGTIVEQDWSAGSTEFSFVVVTTLTENEVQNRLFDTGMNWALVQKYS